VGDILTGAALAVVAAEFRFCDDAAGDGHVGDYTGGGEEKLSSGDFIRAFPASFERETVYALFEKGDFCRLCTKYR
jgi:hypothetical protein